MMTSPYIILDLDLEMHCIYKLLFFFNLFTYDILALFSACEENSKEKKLIIPSPQNCQNLFFGVIKETEKM